MFPLALRADGRGTEAYSRLKRRIFRALLLYLGAITSAILVLIIFEDWSIIDSFYMSILTLTTVGYGEVRPLSDTGKILMSVVMILDNVVYLYAVGSLATFVIEGYALGIFKENKLMKSIDKLKDHYIVVGYGRLGRQTAQTLHNMKHQVVAIDIEESEELVRDDEGVIILRGDGREEDLLKMAGIERARGLSACLPDESDNLVIVITAREFNPEIKMVSRASTRSYIPRLGRAGAEEIVIPEMAAGKQIAFELADPEKRKIARIMELSMTSKMLIEEVSLTASSPLIGKSILETQIRQKWGVFIPFIGREGEDYEPQPDPGRIFEANDQIWLFGPPDSISKFIQEAT